MMSSQALKMGALISAWLGATVTTVVLNKHIFQIMDWKYPITLTVVHMVVCVIGSILTLRVTKVVPFTAINSNEYFSGVLPLRYVFMLLLYPLLTLSDDRDPI
jgi:solute carrier family 35 protein E3